MVYVKHMKHKSMQSLYTDVYCESHAWLHMNLTRLFPLLDKHLCLVFKRVASAIGEISLLENKTIMMEKNNADVE